MIQSLTIRNFVLIEDLTIDFHSGMQVMTGETGAGKSIVVDAVGLVLGGRADRSLIRAGTNKACVEAVFETPGNLQIESILQRECIEYDGSTVTLYREIFSGGKNLCRVCGVVVPVSILKEISCHLMDIHGQHDHQFLMNPEMHLSFLDRMGNAEHRLQTEKTADACVKFLIVHRSYVAMKKETERKQIRMGELENALKTLHAARLKEGEEEQLQKECLRLQNAEKLTLTLRNAREMLSYGDSDLSSLEKIKSASYAVGSLSRFGDQFRNLQERCEQAYYELEEVVFELNGLLDEFEQDPQRKEKAEARLDLIRRLEKKYGPSIGAVLLEQQRMESEYQNLCSLEDRIAETAAEHRKLLNDYRHEARTLTESRKQLADEFENRMKSQLQDLGMEKTDFRVCFHPIQTEKRPMPRPEGDDRIEFMISPNPGEPLRPLAKVASGGELSRMMLALKTLEAEGSGVDCMVFDEIDTGISGQMAQVVAEKMRAIAGHRQVICVTHLPQIAAAADYQLQVSKAVVDGRTLTSVRELDRQERISEVARMISGAEGISADAITYAGSLIEGNLRKRNAAGSSNC